MTITELTNLVASQAKNKTWLSGQFEIQNNGETYKIALKSFGKAVQRLECNGYISNVPEQKTVKRFKELLELELSVITNSVI